MSTPTTASEVVELRRYTLHPAARETLIELFETELIEPQEAVGLRVLGQFRDLDEPDHFVWLRGFADMAARGRGLRAFYDGPVWARHRDAANATMIDSDDVLLLKPTGIGPRLHAAAIPRGRSPLVLIAVLSLCDVSDGETAARDWWRVARQNSGDPARLRALYRTEPAPNNFPQLPVRQGENVLVAIASPTEPNAAHAAYEWQEQLARQLDGELAAAPHVARLVPTERSRIQ